MLSNLIILRKKILQVSYNTKKGHIPSAFSILEILWVLYNEILIYDISLPNDDDRDRFILSKGHASLALYGIFADKGIIDFNELDTFCRFDSRLGGHPHRSKLPWVEASTGSLGHGLPIAVGIAIGLKINKSEKKVYVLIGDGESNEGTIWESALLASNHFLDNLILIVDFNHSNDRALNLGDLCDKFTSFGWHAVSIDGHNTTDLAIAFNNLNKIRNMPKVLIANTIKGFGVKSMENNPAWHHRSPNEQELAIFLTELDLLT